MFYYKEEIINMIKPDKPDPAAAKVLQEILGGHYGEMRTMMQYFSKAQILEVKRNNIVIYFEVFLEEISHVELVQHTINQLLTGSGEPTPEMLVLTQHHLTKQLNMQILITLL